MSRKIFISYKYGDRNVPSSWVSGLEPTTVRHYVDMLQLYLDKNDHINKGEKDGEDLSNFTDETIASKLRDKIFDSSLTIVMISKEMKDPFKQEREQWIPWEVSYSLKEHSRAGRTSRTNAVLAIVLPDSNGSYEYIIHENSCHYCNCTTFNTEILFGIISKNMSNIKDPTYNNCGNHGTGRVYLGNFSYIHTVKWEDYIKDANKHIQISYEINEKIEEYNIHKTI